MLPAFGRVVLSVFGREPTVGRLVVVPTRPWLPTVGRVLLLGRAVAVVLLGLVDALPEMLLPVGRFEPLTRPVLLERLPALLLEEGRMPLNEPAVPLVPRLTLAT